MANKFYVVTVGKDVGVFAKWLQASPVCANKQVEKFATKDEAIAAYDEANSNGFVEIVGCVVDKYRSPRIYPPLNFAPFPRRAGSGPGPGSTPNPPPPPPPSSVPVSPPASPPPSPVRYRAPPLPSSALPSINTPAVRSDDAPKYYSTVTLRSPKREMEEGHSRRGAHPTPTASPRKAKDSPSRSPQIKREPVSLPQIPASPHHRRTVHSAQSTPKRSSSALLHFPSTPATQFSSPMRQSPTRSAVVIDSSDGESYPPGSDFDSETESSEPEDVTPMRTELLSPLNSPVLKGTADIRNSVLFPVPKRSPAKLVKHAMRKDVATSPRNTYNNTYNNSSSASPNRAMFSASTSTIGFSQPSQAPAVSYSPSYDPRSPIRNVRSLAPRELNSSSLGRPSPRYIDSQLMSPGESTLFASY